MTPIKWSGTTWVNTTASDTAWYNYDTTNKIWANAKTADGSMWVWIPRYIYKISTGWHTSTAGTIDIQFSKGVDDNWNKSVIGTINGNESANSSNNTWTNHPAFTFGDTELTGIWVAKFEASAAEGVANGYVADYACPNGGDNTSIKTIKVLPNIQTWRCQSISNAFIASRNMEKNTVYGWGTTGNNIDTHLMKNTEWGAVAYLSKSNYGQGTNEIWINNNQNYVTGCAGNSVSSAGYDGCQNTYETANGVKASTTSNIYGIYDMSGGAWEFVATYVDNGNANLVGPGSLVISADSKYKVTYDMGITDSQANNYVTFANGRGDALYETSATGISTTSWFSDYSITPYSSSPWLIRGGRYAGSTGTGIFAFDFIWVGGTSGSGFRPVLLVNEDL
jgi:hypothetical protein